MRRVLMTVAIVLFASNAWAGTNCYQLGNTVRCDHDGGGSTSCFRLGNTVRCQ
jgi:hypothetical protein